MSQEGLHYRVWVTADAVMCECGDPPKLYCSHIEATMVAGERFMVHPDDRTHADAAVALFAGTFIPPSEWKASWRQRLKWRGLGSGRTQAPSTVGDAGLPVVCFTGAMPRPRKDLIAEAIRAGWEAIDSPHRLITVLVAADPMGTSTKLKSARKWGIPIVSLEEWQMVTTDGEVVASGDPVDGF